MLNLAPVSIFHGCYCWNFIAELGKLSLQKSKFKLYQYSTVTYFQLLHLKIYFFASHTRIRIFQHQIKRHIFITFTCNLVDVLSPGTSPVILTAIGFSVFSKCAVSVSCSKTFRVVLNCKDREAMFLGEVVTVFYWVVGVESDSARYRSVASISPASQTLWTALLFFKC